MKKLMFGMAALAAAASFASIESSNVVGYQNKDIVDDTVGGYTWTLATLPDVGKELETLTLGSWKISVPAGGLTSDYSVNVITFNAAGQIEGDYIYMDADSNGLMQGLESGWYTTESIEGWDPVSADNTIIPFGVGVQIVSDCGATVIFAGQVQKEDTSINIVDDAAGGYTWTGNCSPVPLKLADFGVTVPEGGLTSDYSVNVITFNAAGQIEGDYIYMDADSNGLMQGLESGWYTTESIEGWDPVSAGDVDVASGEMFQIVSDCGAILTVPSAL